MARSRASAKAAGTRFERQVADYLRDTVDDRIDRRVKTGGADKGDIASVRLPGGGRMVIECKDVAKLDLSGWVRESQTEMVNDGAVAAAAVHKRRGKGDPAEQYVTMTLRDLVVLLGGDPIAPTLGQEEQ